MVRLADAQPQPGDKAGSDQGDALSLLQEVGNFQFAQVELLGQISDSNNAKAVAPRWADALADALDRTKRLRLAGGPPKPGSGRPQGGGLAAAARAAAAEKGDAEVIAQLEAGLQRVWGIEGVPPIMEAALVERAGREPQSALAEALTKRGIAVPGAAQ